MISRPSALSALARSDDRVVGGDLQRYVRPVSSYLRVDLEDELVEFLLDNVANKKVFGITAECFLDICRAFVRASNARKLTTDVQRDIARRGAVEREFGRLKPEWAMLPLRVRRLVRVRLHVDLTILAQFAAAVISA